MRTEKLTTACPACGGPVWRVTSSAGHASVVCGGPCTTASVPDTDATVSGTGSTAASTVTLASTTAATVGALGAVSAEPVT